MSFQSALPQSILSAFIAERQKLLGKSDEQVSTEVGFDNPSTISKIKTGSLKLPFSKIPALASALACPASDLLRTVLLAQAPELLAVINKIWSPAILTSNELTLIDAYRHLAKGRDVVPLVMDGQSIIALVTA